MLRIFDDLGTLSGAAAEYIASLARRCVDKRGQFTWLLSGGSTPVGTFRLLSNEPYVSRGFWRQTHFYWSDERCVPPDTDLSNYYLACREFLQNLPTPHSQIHRMLAERPDRDAAAAEYAAILPDHPDLILLGMGPDGHTASLFPGSPALSEVNRRVMAVEGPEYVKLRWRLTITRPVIGAAENVLVLVSGSDKAEALERVFQPEGDVSQTPARLARDAIWFVDRPATEQVQKLDPREIQRSGT